MLLQNLPIVQKEIIQVMQLLDEDGELCFQVLTTDTSKWHF